MKKTSSQTGEISYELDVSVDRVPYVTRITPFIFNDQKRFRISVNGGDDHVLVWDPELVALRPLDDESAILPEELIKAVSDKVVKTIVLR